MQAEANDYIEKEFGAFYRSYPAEGGDALAYQRDGFLWNAAESGGSERQGLRRVQQFITGPGDGGDWKEWYEDSQILEGKASGPLPIPINEYQTTSDIPSLNEINDPDYPRFDLEIPDQYRFEIWKAEFEHEESANDVPSLTLIWLPDDHTGGHRDPVAQVADNDLAFGRIMDTISHSKFWKDSAIFGVEDDTQNGVDHVDGHRGPAFVISPYAKGGVEDEYYITAQHGAHGRADPRNPPDEPGGLRRRTDVRRVHGNPELRTVHGCSQRNPADARRRRLRLEGCGQERRPRRGRGAGLDAGCL